MSHEIIYTGSAGTHIAGDSQNYTFYNNGLNEDWENSLSFCNSMGNYHDISSNTGHFAHANSNKGLIASKNDIIRGGDGDDRLKGLTGNDTLYGNGGGDIVDGGTGDDILYGGDGDDFLFGGDGDNVLDGGNGNDVISIKNGNNAVTGGNGYDFLTCDELMGTSTIQLTDNADIKKGGIGIITKGNGEKYNFCNRSGGG